MSPPPPKLRELCLLALYSKGAHPSQEFQLVKFISQECKVSLAWAELGQLRACAISHHKPKIDSLIRLAALSFEFERIGAVELAILRLGIYEVFCDGTIPIKVAISEATRLARKFCSIESGRFIHAVLDQVYKGAQSQRGEG